MHRHLLSTGAGVFCISRNARPGFNRSVLGGGWAAVSGSCDSDAEQLVFLSRSPVGRSLRSTRTKRQRVAGLRAGRLRPARHQEPQAPDRVGRIRFLLRLPGNSAARNPRPARLEIAAATVRIVRTRNPPHASGTSDRQSSLEKPQTPIPARKPDETPKHTAEQRTQSAPRSSGSSRATHARNNGIPKRTGTSPRNRATGRRDHKATRRRDDGTSERRKHRSIGAS